MYFWDIFETEYINAVEKIEEEKTPVQKLLLFGSHSEEPLNNDIINMINAEVINIGTNVSVILFLFVKFSTWIRMKKLRECQMENNFKGNKFNI